MAQIKILKIQDARFSESAIIDAFRLLLLLLKFYVEYKA